MIPDLEPIWQLYAESVGSHDRLPSAAVYLRESKREQVEGFSPGAQLKGTLDEANKRGFWVPAEYVFLDLMSGRREDRVAFQDLLALARSGQIAAVIVLHTSRWARNAMVSRKYKEELRRRGVEVIAVNAPFDVARPEGKFAERMMEAVDEFASDTIGWWVRVGLREKHEQGEPLGRLPETYFRDANGVIVAHPELSKVVLEGARRYATGRVGFGDLAIWCAREGHRTPKGRPLTDEWWRNTLSNPANAGYVAYHRKRGGKELRRASFPGFIPLELFETVQETRRARTHSPSRRATYRVFPLSGARCGSCGAKVTAAGNGRLRCRASAEHAGCQEKSADADRLEHDFGSWLVSVLAIPGVFKARLAKLVRAKLTRTSDEESATKLRQAIKRLTDAFTWGGLAEADYREQLVALRAELGRAQRAPDERRIAQATKLAEDIPGLWQAARPERRKQLLAALFDTITVAAGRVTAVRPSPELLPLFALKVSDYTSAVPTGVGNADLNWLGSRSRALMTP
jgi:DNA invertase Pin-like site-specific DNA recombinase